MPTIIVQGRRVPVGEGGQAPEDPALPRPKRSWAELPANIVPSAVETATGLWDMVTHPRQAAEGIIDAAQGGVDRVMPEAVTGFIDTYVAPRSTETKERQRRISGELIKALKDRYWGLENLRETLITDPVGSALDAGGVATGGFGLLRRPVAAMAKSRVSGLFNPKPKPQRPFSEDYPAGVELREDGQIARDIEGRPLESSYIAGRTRIDGPDHALTPLDIQSIGEMGIEGPIDRIPASRFGAGSVGRTHLEYGRPTRIEILDSLPKAKSDIATAHEVAHVIDALAGQIPTKGLEKELDFNYSALRTGEERKFFQSGPADFGYTDPRLIDREKIAEAIRAYMVDPNYLKTVAPKTAARIREFVANNPELSMIVRFNALPVGGALALAAAGQSDGAQAGDRSSLAGLVQAMVRRGLSPQAPESAGLNEIVRALMARRTRDGAGP